MLELSTASFKRANQLAKRAILLYESLKNDSALKRVRIPEWLQMHIKLQMGILAMKGVPIKMGASWVKDLEQLNKYALICFDCVVKWGEQTTPGDSEIQEISYLWARENKARLLVSYPHLFPAQIGDRIQYIKDLLTISDASWARLGSDSGLLDRISGRHVVMGRAYLAFKNDVGLAVEEFKAGAMKEYPESGAYSCYLYHSGLPSDHFFDAELDGEDSSDVDDKKGVENAVSVPPLLDSRGKSDVELKDQQEELQNQRTAEGLRLAAEDAARYEAQILEENRKRNALRRAEQAAKRDAEFKKNLQKEVAQPLLPVTKKDITWKVCFPPIAEGVWEEMQRSENKKLFNRCIALIQAIQTNERMGCVETLSHVCLADGSPIMTRRVTIADRMVYSLSGTDNDKVLTIYGLMTHDETIDKMIRSGIARNK